MTISSSYFDELDEGPDFAGTPETPEGYEKLHRFLYIGAYFFFAALAVDGFVVFPLMLIRHGWH